MDSGRNPTAQQASPAEWQTPAERSGYRRTPTYAETIEFLERLQRRNPSLVRIEDVGSTGEGRDLKVVIVSKDALFTPEEARRVGRVVLLVQNAIHAGEMDGKDACLALLRDILTEPSLQSVLDRVVWLFIPVYNIDGHERLSPFHRINQNGPEVMGWRANASNLNLNRDYMKADAPETRAFLRLFHRWLPDFFVDNHVTDGADFQYDVTFVVDTTPDVYPPVADWVARSVVPALVDRLEAAGHPTFPTTVFLKDETDPSQGLALHDNPPRFSTGRVLLEGRPGLLVELHMLKDYPTRVHADYVLMRALLGILQQEASTLARLSEEADQSACALGREPAFRGGFPLVIESDGSTEPVRFRGFDYERTPSGISGRIALRYTSTPRTETLPMEVGARVSVSVPLPAGYIIPPGWAPAIDVLEAQGIAIRRLTAPWTGEVGIYHLSEMEWPPAPFEGRHPILRGGNVERAKGRFGKCLLTVEATSFPRGSAVALLDQRLSKVVVHWLEPEAPDSAVRWGFFDSIFEQKEGGEGYVVEQLAPKMIEKDPSLRAEFERRLQTDPVFRDDPEARLGFFYERSDWGRANRVGRYPVGRLASSEGLPLTR